MSSQQNGSQSDLRTGQDPTTAYKQSPSQSQLRSGIDDHDHGLSEDWLERPLHELACNDAEVRAFLKDYAQCKDCRLDELLESMAAYSYFEPPSNVQYWAPRNLPTRGQGLEPLGESQKPTFSQALGQLRISLQKGEPGCARFW